MDIVILCTPNDLHASQTIQAARAGKHIIIEKPVALNLAELRAMQQAVHAASVTTIVSFVLHWTPSLLMTKRLIESGAIGRVFMVETSYWHRSPRAEPGHWFTRKDMAGSVFLLGGCHAVDAARWLAGTDIVEVTAYSTRGRPAWVRLRPDRDRDGAVRQRRHRPNLGYHGMRDAVRVQRDRHGRHRHDSR